MRLAFLQWENREPPKYNQRAGYGEHNPATCSTAKDAFYLDLTDQAGIANQAIWPLSNR